MNELPPLPPNELLNEAPDEEMSDTDAEGRMEKETLVAEDIAVLQIELEEKIVSESIPESEWAATTQKFIRQNPKLESYEGLILTYVKRCAAVKKNLENTWNLALLDVEDISNDTQVACAVANQIGLNPEIVQPLRVVKNSQALVFYLDEKSFVDFHAEDAGELEDPKRLEHLTGSNDRESYGVPVIFLKEGQDKNRVFIRYEAQSLKNNALNLYASAVDGVVSLNGRARSFVELKVNDDPIEASLENKILSLFAAQINNSPEIPEGRKQIEGFAECIAADLKESELTRYFEIAKERQENIAGTQDYYKQVIDDAVGWLTDLILVNGPIYEERSVEVSINTLQQFKISNWPRIARVIIHRKGGLEIAPEDKKEQ